MQGNIYDVRRVGRDARLSTLLSQRVRLTRDRSNSGISAQPSNHHPSDSNAENIMEITDAIGFSTTHPLFKQCNTPAGEVNQRSGWGRASLLPVRPTPRAGASPDEDPGGDRNGCQLGMKNAWWETPGCGERSASGVRAGHADGVTGRVGSAAGRGSRLPGGMKPESICV